MNLAIYEELWRELRRRGFKTNGASPHDTMVFSETFLGDVEIGDFFEDMVARREKVSRSEEVVGPDAARRSYEDAVLVIGAIKAVIGKLTLP